MSEKIAPGPIGGNACFREAVCVHTTKVYDSCKSKECIRDLRVYLTAGSQAFINNNCVTVRPRTAELLHVNINVEKVRYKCNTNYFNTTTNRPNPQIPADLAFFSTQTSSANSAA